jgi:acyl-CoA synthetase (AMP-forming)/AMP-acid ligase II
MSTADTLYFPALRSLAATAGFHARRRPGAIAVRCGDRSVTYAELHRRSNRTAHALVVAGLRPGSRVGYLGKESEQYYDVLFGCAKSGTVLVPVNWRLTGAEVSHILRDSGTEVLFVEPEYRGLLDAVRTGLPALHTVVDLGPSDVGGGVGAWSSWYPDTDLEPQTGPDDPIVQIYTSGTTGLPKGVVLPHRSFFAIRDALANNGLDWIDWRPGDVNLVCIPGFHIGGLWWAVQAFNAGLPNVVMRTFSSRQAVEEIRRHRVTTTCLVPAMLQMLLAERSVSTADFGSLRKVVYGGSPISESLLVRALDLIGCEFAQIYGLTETGNTAVCLPPDQHVPGSPRLAAAGRPYPGVELDVVGPGGVPLPPGEAGEIRIRTPARMLEYWRLLDATAATLVDGWIHTGDAGVLDADGYLYIRDRIKDVIIVAGENVYPAEIENALSRHPAVAEAAVVGVPDERWGEGIHAVVAFRDGAAATPRELMLGLRGSVADFKLPTSYEFVDRLPRNPSGKILRRELRDRFWQHSARKVN